MRYQPTQLAGGIYGLLVGDALGVPYEFHSANVPEQPYRTRGSGFVVDTLRSAQAVQSAGDYASIVRAAIALGNDTDTTACVAGGIAGIRFGLAGIPAHWLADLQGRDIVEPLVAQLIAWQQGTTTP
jgi:ADP-ribosyl-[dinitrogen reductase] hydrolase